MPDQPSPGVAGPTRVAVFVDYWNFQLTLNERESRAQGKAPPRCPTCHREILFCPHQDCQQRIEGTIEKGVDTLIATDMIRLAWENAYDLAVLASSDADLIPAVDFLRLKARKVVQAGFPPLGTALATACWASFDVFRDREEIRRP